VLCRYRLHHRRRYLCWLLLLYLLPNLTHLHRRLNYRQRRQSCHLHHHRHRP
jgi:hypothetical protein